MFQYNASVFWLLVIFVFSSPISGDETLKPIEQRLLGGVVPPVANNGASVASIRLKTSQMEYHIGGGFIINKHWVGTAAQCLVNQTIYNTVVAVGRPTVSGGTIYALNEIEMHQNFNALTLAHDIGLVRTETAFTFGTNVQLIPLGAPILAQYNADLYGWGRITAAGGLSEALRTSVFAKIDYSPCVSSFPFVARRFVSEDRQICFLRSTGATCPGDAGGPIVFNNAVVGIISWIDPCVAGQTSVHTRISFYTNWIQRFTRPDD